jgi:hypothetical protein
MSQIPMVYPFYDFEYEVNQYFLLDGQPRRIQIAEWKSLPEVFCFYVTQKQSDYTIPQININANDLITALNIENYTLNDATKKAAIGFPKYSPTQGQVNLLNYYPFHINKLKIQVDSRVIIDWAKPEDNYQILNRLYLPFQNNVNFINEIDEKTVYPTDLISNLNGVYGYPYLIKTYPEENFNKQFGSVPYSNANIYIDYDIRKQDGTPFSSTDNLQLKIFGINRNFMTINRLGEVSFSRIPPQNQSVGVRNLNLPRNPR